MSALNVKKPCIDAQLLLLEWQVRKDALFLCRSYGGYCCTPRIEGRAQLSLSSSTDSSWYKSRMRTLAIILAGIAIAGCNKKIDAGEQCLNSFRLELKDPKSGEVVSFNEPRLIYTATNSYGARVQGRALCYKSLDMWSRDRSAEQIGVIQAVTEKLEQATSCVVNQTPAESCMTNSSEVKRALRAKVSTDQDALFREARKELGYE